MKVVIEFTTLASRYQKNILIQETRERGARLCVYNVKPLCWHFHTPTILANVTNLQFN